MLNGEDMLYSMAINAASGTRHAKLSSTTWFVAGCCSLGYGHRAHVNCNARIEIVGIGIVLMMC